jgi:tRNA G18 (ribose-2'-O)-methylase SpoU
MVPDTPLRAHVGWSAAGQRGAAGRRAQADPQDLAAVPAGGSMAGMAPATQPIDDPGDPRVADYLALTDTALRGRLEPAAGLFIAEGELVVRRAVQAGYRLRSLLLDPRALGRLADLAADAGADGVPVYLAGQAVLRRITGFQVHRGVLASVARKPLPAAAELLAGASRVAVLEDLANPTNLGAIVRSAAGLGMDAVLLNPTCADPLYRRSVRVSMGQVLTVPFARLAPWPAALAELRAAGFRLLALTPDPHAEPLDRLDAPTRRRAALLLGTEGAGLSAAALAAADRWVRIPMARGVDSLNVAAAAAVAFWTLGRRG